MKKILMICICLFLTGCMHFSGGYSSVDSKEPYKVPDTNKVPVTFSLRFEHVTGISASDEKKLKEKIRKSLESTGIFSSVVYSDGTLDDNYHIKFKISRNGSGKDAAMGYAFGAGIYILYLIPIVEDNYLDGSAAVYLRGKEIASFGRAEKLTCVYWLPCVVAWPVANGYFVWNRVENKVIDGLVSDLSKKHMENFAKR